MKALMVLVLLMAGIPAHAEVNKNVKACVIHMVKDVGVPVDKAFDFCIETYEGKSK